MYSLRVNGTEYNQVDGTLDWQKVITRDFNDRIFRTKGDFNFVGWGNLYNLLYNNLASLGACNAQEARVYFRPDKQTAYTEWWRGEMKPQDIEFDLINSSADAQILEDTWAAKFANSEDSKIFLRSTESKNGEFIPSSDSDLCDFFDPGDPVLGGYNFPDRRCFKMFDVFTFLVDYHTDGTASFASDFFSSGGDGDQYYITTGEEIRTGSGGANPEVSFSECFEELNKKENLFIIIESDDFDNPVLRIEPFSYVFKDQKVITVENPESITLGIDLDQLYTIIEVGSDATDYDNADNANFPDVRFNGWTEESYNTPGDCEFENNTLDLVSSWKIDNNSIEQQLAAATAGDPDGPHDQDIFLVSIDSTTLDAIKYTTDFTGTETVDYIYNFNLTNEQVLLAWFDGIPQEIIKVVTKDYYTYVDTPTVIFYFDRIANLDCANDSTGQASDVDDIYEFFTTTNPDAPGSGNYGVFTVPVGGLYNFNCRASVRSNTDDKDIRLVVWVYEDDTLATVIRKYKGDYTYCAAGVVVTLDYIYPMTLNAGESAIVAIQKDAPNGAPSYDVFSGRVIMTAVTPDYLPVGDQEPLIWNYSIGQFKLSLADFNTLDNNLGYMQFVDTKTGRHWNLWAKELQYNPVTMIAQGDFIGKPSTQGLCWILEEGIWADECFWIDEEIWIDPGGEWFIMTVKTDNAGASNNDQFQIPTNGAGYNYIVDWGDDSQSLGVTGDKTHTYSIAGTYTVKIRGAFPTIYFNGGGDDTKVLTIEQWGDNVWTSMADSFSGCGNMTANYIDYPNVSAVTDFSSAFLNCSNFNGQVGDWDVSSGTDFSSMFQGASVFNNDSSNKIRRWDTSAALDMGAMFFQAQDFNQPIRFWDVSSVTDMSNMFRAAITFNQSLKSWDTSSVTTMLRMFLGSTSFEQSLKNWDVGNVTTMSAMFQGVGLNTSNYDDTLTGWTGWAGGAATKTVQASVTFTAGSSTYSLGSDAADARTWLQAAPQLWTITDGGGV